MSSMPLVGVTHSFEYEPPNGQGLAEAASYLTEADDFHGKGKAGKRAGVDAGFVMDGYRPFRLLMMRPSRGCLTVRAAPQDESALRAAFDKYLSKRTEKTGT